MRSSMRPSGGNRWGRIALLLVVVASVTFVAAYYVPLVRAHADLTAEHRRAADKVQSAEREVTSARTELKASRDKLATLEAERQAQEAGKGQATSATPSTEKRDATRAQLTALLEKHLKKGVAAVALQDGQLVVALADALVFAPRKLDVTPAGRALLCQLAKANDGALRVVGTDNGQKPPPGLAQKYPSAWVLRAARAGSVAEALENKCSVPAARLSAAGSATASAKLGGAKPPAQHLELQFLNALP
ncbi:MAG TPA: hypothetical protein VER33_21810 [Polyangiaceae bacterium]|nr:hypothetical protein [Polyangiaceae bacterium]